MLLDILSCADQPKQHLLIGYFLTVIEHPYLRECRWSCYHFRLVDVEGKERLHQPWQSVDYNLKKTQALKEMLNLL